MGTPNRATCWPLTFSTTATPECQSSTGAAFSSSGPLWLSPLCTELHEQRASCLISKESRSTCYGGGHCLAACYFWTCSSSAAFTSAKESCSLCSLFQVRAAAQRLWDIYSTATTSCADQL